MNKVFNDEKPSAFDLAMASMPSSDGVPVTEAWLLSEMACTAGEDTLPAFWPAFLAWLRSPHF